MIKNITTFLVVLMMSFMVSAGEQSLGSQPSYEATPVNTSAALDATNGDGMEELCQTEEVGSDDLLLAQSCCRICRKGKACGNSCINRSYTCHQPPGCACNG